MPSPFEDRKLQLARINQLAILVAIVFLVLLARLWYLQIAQGDNLLKQSEFNRIKRLWTRAPRGTILDCKGRTLATSKPQFVVTAVPDVVRTNPEAFHTLAGILRISPEELEAIFDDSNVRPGSPVRVAVDVDLGKVAQIGELRMRLPGVSVELDQIRYYPDGEAVAHIMGALGEINPKQLDQAQKEGKDYRPGDYVGQSGLEKEYESYLRGKDGGKRIEVNASGRVVRILGEQQSVAGRTLELSIDRDLQVAASKALGDQTGAVVAVDPRSGAVLAMVSKPAYDPNVFVKRVKVADWKSINENPQKPLQNRSVQNVYAPGSTFKPMVAIAGLVYGECDLQTTVNCPGSFYFGRRFRCWKVHGSGVTFDRAIAESCDVWFYRLGLRLGVDRMAQVVRQFGIGWPTGIDLPGETRHKDGHFGTMPDTQWKLQRYHQKWYPGETPSVSIGQGYVEVSPLQMATAIAGIANGGTIYRPHLMAAIVDAANHNNVLTVAQPRVNSTVNAPPEQFEMVRQAMRKAVTQGTCRVCDIPDVTVAGKTGSAQNSLDGRPMPAHAWFVCFAPVENPTIAIACIVEHGRHGATAAAPVARAILDVYYGKKKPEDIGSGRASISGD